MARKDILGRWGETMAANTLAGIGYAIIERNWRCSAGELDIVAQDGECIVFVEVKTRQSADFGHPLESITAHKCARLRVLAGEWCRRHPEVIARRIRIDAVGIIGDGARVYSLDHRQAIAT